MLLFYYSLMQLAGIADRHDWKRIADTIRQWVPMARIERGVSSLLRSSFRLVVTRAGGCGVDVDNEHDLDVARLRYDEWSEHQRERAQVLYGSLPLPERASEGRS